MVGTALLFKKLLALQAALCNGQRMQAVGGYRFSAITASAVSAILDTRKRRIDVTQLDQLVAEHGDIGVVEEIRFGPVLGGLEVVEQCGTARFIARRMQCRANSSQCLGSRGAQRLFELLCFLLDHGLAFLHSEGFSVREFTRPDE